MGKQRIDFFEQWKNFDQCCLEDRIPGLTGNHRSVYFSLLTINNSKQWTEIFDVDYQYMLDLSKVDKETYRRAMDLFNKSGLFDHYEKGINKYCRARVSLKVLSDIPTGNTVANTPPNQPGNTLGTPLGIEASNEDFLKTTNNKQKNINKTKRDFDLSFISPEFLEPFKKWLDYKKSRGESYKNDDSLLAAYNNLKKLSNENSQVAAEIIDQSLANNYAGLFKLPKSSLPSPMSPNIAIPKFSKAEAAILQAQRLKMEYNDESQQ